MDELLNLILFYSCPKTRDTLLNLVGTASEVDNLHVTVAVGRADEQERSWILRKTAGLAERGKFTYLEMSNPLGLAKRACARKTEWILRIGEDDAISVNLVRALAEMLPSAQLDVSAVAPYAYMQYSESNANLERVQPIAESQQPQRLISLLGQPNIIGELSWSAMRRKFYLDYLEFLQSRCRLEMRPNYEHELLSVYLGMRGKILPSQEMCVYTKNNQVWATIDSAIVEDAAGYSNKTSTLLHELYWISDAYTLLASHGLEKESLAPLTVWAEWLLSRGIEFFEARLRILGLEQSVKTDADLSLIRKFAEKAKLLTSRPPAQHPGFYREVQVAASAHRAGNDSDR